MEEILLPIQLAQTLREGVAIEDDTGRLIFVNRTLEQLLGYRSGELIGQPWTVLLPGHREDQDKPNNDHQTRLSRRDGSTVPVVPAAWRQQVATDLGPRRLSLFRDSVEKGSPDNLLYQAADKSGREEFLASIAHELNNPLTIITLQFQLLAKAASPAPLLGSHLAIIQDQVQRMKRIIEDLRASSYPYVPQLEPTDIHMLIHRTLGAQEHRLRAADIALTIALAPIATQAQADPHQLQQVFVNLIENACQALAETDPPRKLLIATSPILDQNGQASRLLIRFSNNGPPIPADVMPYIFESFFTTKKQSQGTGLGLTICERIVTAHGGRIWAENEAEAGVAFVIELPLCDVTADSLGPPRATSQRKTAPPVTPHSTSAGLHILVVDDEPQVVRVAEHLLQQSGFEVTTATDVKQALRVLERKQVDLIISDLSMPHIDGARFYRLVLARHPHLAGRIIFSTGDTGSQRLRSFLRECGCAWIGKPFQAAELLHLIRATLPAGRVPA